MMTKRFLTICTYVLIAICAFPAIGSAHADSTYCSYGRKYSAKLFLSDKFLSVLYDNGIHESTFKSNRPLSVGVGFYTGKMGMSVSYGFDFMRNHSKGDTESIDMQYSYFGRRFMVDIVGQWYKGFYEDDSSDGDEYVIYNDMEIVRVGINPLYALNGDRLSLKAVFADSERQTVSAGSFLLGGNVGYDLVFPGSAGEIRPGPRSRIATFMIGPSAGYAYSWVTGGFHINSALSFNLDMKIGPSCFKVSPSVVPRIGLGYDKGDWELFTSYKNYLSFPLSYGGGRLTLSSGVIVLGFVRRFGVI